MFPSLRRWLGRGVCPYQFSFVLTSWFRRLILSPETLAERLDLSPDMTVLELGPGPGYFSSAVARCLPQGRHLLVDLQIEMLEIARRRIHNDGSLHIHFIQASGFELPFASDSIDAVFLVAVFGEIRSPVHALREMRRVLKPGGLLSLTEQPGDPDFVPQKWYIENLPLESFERVNTFGKGKNFTLNFRKAG
jgi:uncharacterized protein